MDLTLEEIGDWIDDLQGTLPTDAYLATLLEAASAMPIGAEGRAELLVAAGEAVLPSDPDRALDLHQQAADDGGRATIHPHSAVLDVLLTLGREEAVAAHLVALRGRHGEPRSDSGLHHDVGEVLEHHQRLPEAERWFSIGLREFDPELDEPDLDEDRCLAGRFRVRRARGRGMDAYDRWFEADAPDAATAIRERTQTAPSERQ